MDPINQQRFLEVQKQLAEFKPEDATPTTDFNIAPEYTLIARLPANINARIHTLSRELQERFPEHYYYSTGQYHLTIVPIPVTIEPKKAIAWATPLLADQRLALQVYGYGANRFQASAVLYPETETLAFLRKKLRAAFGIPDQAYTIHRSVWEELVWVNFMRFTVQPTSDLLKLLRDHARDDLGHCVIDRYELHSVSTKTLAPASSRLIHTFNT